MRMPTITTTIAQNSVVLSACFVSVLSRISVPLLPTPDLVVVLARAVGVATPSPFVRNRCRVHNCRAATSVLRGRFNIRKQRFNIRKQRMGGPRPPRPSAHLDVRSALALSRAHQVPEGGLVADRVEVVVM